MTSTDRPQKPCECKHYGEKKKCTAGWFRSKCCLCYKCIHCPDFTPKTKEKDGR